MDPITERITQADSLEDLARAYVEHHAEWTPAHTLAAMEQVLQIQEWNRMAELDQHYHDGDYAAGN